MSVTLVERVLIADAGRTKVSALWPIERRLAEALRRAFLKQGQVFLAQFARFRPIFDRPKVLREAAPLPEWESAFDESALATMRVFREPLDQVIAEALDLGIIYGVAQLGLETSLSLKHPSAVAYVQGQGAARVTRINQTTRRYLRTVLTQAAEEGWSYDRTAKAITQRYAQFAGPPLKVRPRHIRSRAHAIAVFEVGDAYEHGNMLVAQDLKAAGLTVEKSWLTVGDDRVRPEHRVNQSQGWIPLDDPFLSGHLRPPTDPGCRCTVLMRRKPAAAEEPEEPQEEVPEGPTWSPGWGTTGAFQAELLKTGLYMRETDWGDLELDPGPSSLEMAKSILAKNPKVVDEYFKVVDKVPEKDLLTWSQEKKAVMLSRLIDRMIGLWGSTSWGAPGTLPATVQIAAFEEFGMKVAWAPDDIQTLKKHPETAKRLPLTRLVLREMYDQSQARLAAKGIEFLPVARGVLARSWKSKPKPGAPETRDVVLAPLSSFTLDLPTAERFGRNGGVVMTAMVPRELVFSWSTTGFGTAYEYEVVLLGGSPYPVEARVT